MRYIILLYAILNPMFFLCDVEPRDAQTLFYQISSMIVFGASLFFENRATKRDPAHLWLGIMILCFLFAWGRSMAGFSQVLNFILGILVYLAVIRTLKAEDFRFILKGVLGVTILSSAYLLAQKYLHYDLFGITNRASDIITYSSFFLQNSAMGMYHAQVMPLLMALSPITAILAFPVMLSQSAGALLGAVAGTMFFLWFRKRVIFWIALLPIIAGIVFCVINPENLWSFKLRLPMWGMVAQDTLRNPLGYGFDEFADPKQTGHWKYTRESYENAHITIKMIRQPDNRWVLSPNPSEEFLARVKNQTSQLAEWDHPHNEYLWLGYEGGLASLIPLGFIIYYVSQRFKRSKREVETCALAGALICVAACCVSQFYLHMARTAHLLPIMLGFFYLKTEE